MNSIRLCLVLHNHQPIGNFDGVFEQAYFDAYQPFLDVFERYDFPIGLHTSGPLMEWLDERKPEYIDRLAKLVAKGRVEIVGGAFYEPILTMIPPRDRVGQITAYTEWLQSRLSAKVQGMWMPERVWEQSLTSDLANSGIKYTVLDDFHFKNAGLTDEQLYGYYLTEDDRAPIPDTNNNPGNGTFVMDGQNNPCCDWYRDPATQSPSMRVASYFGGAHPGGMNACMADGSCRSISFNISTPVFSSVANKEDGGSVTLE